MNYHPGVARTPEANCSLARSLEIVGERWTLLIVRDAFFGVRRFNDFATQLGIPRAVLTSRLKTLVEAGVLERRGAEYELTDAGLDLLPVIRALMGWGDAHTSPGGPRRVMRHDADDGLLDAQGVCETCGGRVPVPDIRIEPGPGFDPSRVVEDPVSAAINGPRRLLEPIRP